ncbi:TAD3 [Candida jiufengensis]|uniref:TAD3 n=1 Tax=Candida jiufengensis TaxID=497108 RepID=UPI0022246881|nr:TAD3 [Candida jiufengensis]KAI5951478.1 TAD3 [Candida jiufengensis]
MTKTKNNDTRAHVDLKTGILYKTLKQIRKGNDIDPDEPDLAKVWSCEINPKEARALDLLLKKYYDDEVDLKHLKRFRKIGKDTLQGIICIFKDQDDQKRLVLDQLKEVELQKLEVIEVPKFPAFSKESIVKWSETWPMLWKGNPNHQFLNSTTFDMEQERTMISNLLAQVKKNESTFPSATIMAKDVNGQLIIQTVSTSSGGADPQEHSIMKAVKAIADKEVKNRSLNYQLKEERGYLCTDMIVYTTHEPCVMCSMALVHSRIQRLTYLKSVSNGGGIESSYYLGDLDGLNWKFPIWRWLGETELNILNELNESDESVDY